jgi:hypothetical protein
MRVAKLFELVVVALAPLTFAPAEASDSLLPSASMLLPHPPVSKVQNFSPVRTAVINCTWTCSGIRTETLCPSGTHCSCTCTSAGPYCECVVPP